MARGGRAPPRLPLVQSDDRGHQQRPPALFIAVLGWARGFGRGLVKGIRLHVRQFDRGTRAQGWVKQRSWGSTPFRGGYFSWLLNDEDVRYYHSKYVYTYVKYNYTDIHLSLSLYLSFSLSLYTYIYIYIYIYYFATATVERRASRGSRQSAVALPLGVQYLSKGGSVETGCSVLHYVIGCFTT